MLSRHFLRAKVLQAVYAAQADPVDLAVAENNFKHNILRLNDLGITQISSMVHLVEVASVVMEEGEHKFMPTDEERNPNRRLLSNRFIQRLADNYDYRRQCDNANVNWGGVEYDEVFRQAFRQLSTTPQYKEYLASDDTFEADKQYAIMLFKFMMCFEPLSDLVYRGSLLWEDDYEQIAQYNYMMLKTLDESFDEATVLPPVHDMRTDLGTETFDFARQLLLATLRHTQETGELIRKYLKGWELERVAGMDILLLNMAVAELTEFPSIPERVTVDEYIELSKEFSTERSKLFINGILDKLIAELRRAGRINKSGRGLADPSLMDE